MTRLCRAVGLVLLGAACNRPLSSGAGQQGARPEKRATAASSASSAAVEPRAQSRPPALPDGCYAGIDGSLDARPLLAELARRCAQTMEPLWPEPIVFELDANEQHTLPFTIDDASRCLRIIAAGGHGIGELELSVHDAGTRTLGRDDLEGPFALVQREGPICLARPGSYRAVARVTSGRGHVAVEVYLAVDQRRSSVQSTAPSRSTRATTSP